MTVCRRCLRGQADPELGPVAVFGPSSASALWQGWLANVSANAPLPQPAEAFPLWALADRPRFAAPAEGAVPGSAASFDLANQADDVYFFVPDAAAAPLPPCSSWLLRRRQQPPPGRGRRGTARRLGLSVLRLPRHSRTGATARPPPPRAAASPARQSLSRSRRLRETSTPTSAGSSASCSARDVVPWKKSDNNRVAAFGLVTEEVQQSQPNRPKAKARLL